MLHLNLCDPFVRNLQALQLLKRFTSGLKGLVLECKRGQTILDVDNIDAVWRSPFKIFDKEFCCIENRLVEKLTKSVTVVVFIMESVDQVVSLVDFSQPQVLLVVIHVLGVFFALSVTTSLGFCHKFERLCGEQPVVLSCILESLF